MLFTILTALAALALKCPAFANPLTGYFGSYQAVNAMMAEMMGGAPENLLMPRTFILMGGAPGFHLLYYPFGGLAAFLLNALFGGGIPWWGRAQAAVFILGATLLIYPVGRRFLDEPKARLAVFLFSFFPMVLLSGICLQNEAAAVFFLLVSFWWLDSKKDLKIFASGLVFSLALTARIHFAVVFPAFLVHLTGGGKPWRRLAAFAGGVLLPVGLWIFWLRTLNDQNLPYVQTSLFAQTGEGRFVVGALFESADFYRRIFGILGTYWCTPVMLPFVVHGLLRWERRSLELPLWIAGSLSVIVLLPQKVMDHPFYLLAGAPALALVAASSLGSIWHRWPRIFRSFFCAGFVLLALRSYVPPAIHFSDTDRRLPEIGAFVEQRTRPEDRVIAQHGSSADLLYYCRRTGWPFDLAMTAQAFGDSRQERHQKLLNAGYGDPVVWLEKLRKDGARYLVISEPSAFAANRRFSEYVKSRYPEVDIPRSSFIMFKLENS
jgi:hypothetical protein